MTRTQYQRDHYERNKAKYKERARSKHLLDTYGMTPRDYAMFFNATKGRCWICKRLSESRALSVDHNHATGQVRGLLCGNCNRGLGLFKDDPHLLSEAAWYLTRAEGDE